MYCISTQSFRYKGLYQPNKRDNTNIGSINLEAIAKNSLGNAEAGIKPGCKMIKMMYRHKPKESKSSNLFKGISHFCLLKYLSVPAANLRPNQAWSSVFRQGKVQYGVHAGKCRWSVRALYRHQTVSRFLFRPAPETPEASQAADSLSASAYHRRLQSRIFSSPGRRISFSRLLDNGDSAHSDLHTLILTPRPAALTTPPRRSCPRAHRRPGAARAHSGAFESNQGHDHSRASPPELYFQIERAAENICHHVERRRQQSLRDQLRPPGFTNLVVRNSELADIKRL